MNFEILLYDIEEREWRKDKVRFICKRGILGQCKGKRMVRCCVQGADSGASDASDIRVVETGRQGGVRQKIPLYGGV